MEPKVVKVENLFKHEKDESRRQIVSEINIALVIKNLSLTLSGAYDRVDSSNLLQEKIKWHSQKPLSNTVEVCRARYHSIRSDYLPKLRYSIASLHSRFEPMDCSSPQSQYNFNCLALAILPICDLIDQTMTCLAEINSQKSTTSSYATKTVPASRIMLVAQDVGEINSLWSLLIHNYEMHLDEISGRIGAGTMTSESLDEVSSLQNQLMDLVNRTICRMNCNDENFTEGRGNRRKFCAIHYGINAIVEPVDQFEWLMAEIPNRLKSLYDMIDGNLWIENDAFNINFSHKNLNFANTENLKKLKSPFVSLKELFFEIKTKDLLINSAMVSKKEKEGVLEISKIITEQIINTLIALRFSMYNFEDTLKVNDNFVVTESQLDLVQKDIKKIYHCWLGLVECIERFLMALETCDDRIDAGQTVLSLEISWRFDLCLGFVDEANLHLNLYKHSNFIEDLYSLDEKFATKMDWIDYFFKKTLNNRALNLIRDLDLNQIPNDLRIDYNSVFLKTWKRLMTLFLLFIKKASRKNRSLMKIYLILDKDKLILLLQEIHKWSQNYCVDLQHGWIVSKDKEIGETVESMIDSIKNFQTVFFKLRPAKQNTKCKKPNCYIDKVFGHIENIENHLFDIDRVDENEEEKELRTWLEHWLDQVILILKSCFRIHFQSFQSH